MKSNLILYVSLFVGAALLFDAANGKVASFAKESGDVQRRQPHPRCPSEKLYDISSKWSLKLTSQVLAENPDKNVFIAPTSVSMALSLLLMGANGGTEAEMEEALGYGDMRRRQYLCHMKVWKNTVPNPLLTLGTASRLYVDDDMEVKEEYRNIIRRNGNIADFDQVNFSGAPEDARKSINDWVSQQTKGHIDELFSADSINSQTRMAVTSAIYFQGLWKESFMEETFVEPFRLADNTLVDVEYMFNNNMQLRFLENRQGVDFIELPYQTVEGGHEVSMIALKATEYMRLGLADVEEKIADAEFMQQSIQQLISTQPTSIDVKLPVLTIQEEYDLKSTLTAMGMGSMFDQGLANFRGITDEPLYVDQILHKTFFKMDEKGVEAAGATGLQMLPMMMSPSFFATKPFHFFLYEHGTKSILFAGKIFDPSVLG